jgi:hypothetical protein
VPGLTVRNPESADHLDRCWLELEDKRRRRNVDGRIGLASEGPVIA